ncbi:hypothetical protein C8J56DRAFT_909009 [Mycena floridula]|nr:hypothetical protein C8J56DRAFT_909009 [Mycena floridula]
MRLSTILSATVLLATLAYGIPISDQPTGSVKARTISLQARKDDSHTRDRDRYGGGGGRPAPAPPPPPPPPPPPQRSSSSRALVLHQMTCRG